MKKSITNEEKLIMFLNQKFQSAKTNKVSIYKQDLSSIGLTEQETIRTVCLLEQDGIIEIVRMSASNDLCMPCSVNINSSCIHYFENKEDTATSEFREKVQTYVPNILSVIAIVISIVALVTSLK